MDVGKLIVVNAPPVPFFSSKPITGLSSIVPTLTPLLSAGRLTLSFAVTRTFFSPDSPSTVQTVSNFDVVVSTVPVLLSCIEMSSSLISSSSDSTSMTEERSAAPLASLTSTENSIGSPIDPPIYTVVSDREKVDSAINGATFDILHSLPYSTSPTAINGANDMQNRTIAARAIYIFLFSILSPPLFLLFLQCFYLKGHCSNVVPCR